MAKQRLRFQNETRQTILGDKILQADTYFTRLFGLLPRSGLQPGEGLWILPCKDIHSIGMRFEFDALFLDADLVVIHLIQRMKPLRISPFIRQAKSVLELPPGVIEQTETQMGDHLIYTAL